MWGTKVGLKKKRGGGIIKYLKEILIFSFSLSLTIVQISK